MNTRPRVAPHQSFGRLLLIQDAAEVSTSSRKMLLVCLVENWLTLEKEQSGQDTELWTSFASSARVSMPCMRIGLAQQSWPWETLEMLSTEQISPFQTLGHLWKSPFLVLFAERSLEVAPNKFLPHFLLGHNLEVIWREEAISREAFELWALVLWHFFTLPGWLSLFQMLRKNRSSKLGYFRLLEVREMCLHKAPENKVANFYLHAYITSSPNPSLPLGLWAFFLSLLCAWFASRLWKNWGLWFIFIVHRAKGRIITWRGKEEFYTNHICVKETWKARSIKPSGWEPSYSLCLPWHTSWSDVDLDTSSLLINSMVGFFSLQCSLLHCSVLHRCDLTVCSYWNLSCL